MADDRILPIAELARCVTPQSAGPLSGAPSLGAGHEARGNSSVIVDTIGSANGPREFQVKLCDVIEALSMALDAVDRSLMTHHHEVAYIALRLAEVLRLGPANRQLCVNAALIHDLGLVRNFHHNPTEISQREADLFHPVAGGAYLAALPELAALSDIVKLHHFSFRNLSRLKNRPHVPSEVLEIVYAADSTALLINHVGRGDRRGDAILEEHAKRGRQVEFSAPVADALVLLAKDDTFWLDLANGRSLRRLNSARLTGEVLGIRNLLAVSRLFSHLIDGRSQFTANHSFAVAFIAKQLGKWLGWGDDEAEMLAIAGNLHDIGKLAVPNSLIEKPGKLEADEWRTMRSHTYQTRRILETVDGLGPIVDWASDHHEKINGDGYPMRKKGGDVSAGARIIAVADILTALTEERPYRQPMSRDNVVKIIQVNAENGSIDRVVVDCAISNYDQLNHMRAEAQKLQASESDGFWANIDSELHATAQAFTSGATGPTP